MQRGVSVAVLSLLILSAAPNAAAQFDTSWTTDYAINQTRFNMMMADTRFHLMMAERQAGAMRRAQLAGRALPRSSSLTATRFSSASGPIAPERLGARYGRTAGERRDLTRLAHALLARYREAQKRSGAPENDVAEAMAYSLGAAYFIYSEGRARLTTEQSRGLAQIMRAFIIEHPPFRAMADRDKQEAYETLAIMSMYALARFDDAQRRNDAAALADLRQMAVSHITETVGPMDSIMLTRDGFMYR